MKLDSLDYKLPSELIAMKPISPRDNSTLVEVNKEFKVKKFFQLSNILKKGDCLIVNDTKVLPAYLEGESENSKITITLNKLIKKKPFVMWSAFCKPLKKIKKNSKIMFSGNLVSEVININYDSQLPYLILTFKTSYKSFLEKISSSDLEKINSFSGGIRPEWTISYVLPVPPLKTRPTIFLVKHHLRSPYLIFIYI